MATNHLVCSICSQQNTSTQSKVWCVECEEPFCENHASNHKLMNSTKHHVTIPIEDQLKIADAISDVQQYCQKHKNKLVQFCLKHDQPICNECIWEHAKCGDVISLSKLFEQARSSDILTGVAETVEDYIANIQKMRKNRTERKRIIQQEKIKSLSDIKQYRERLNSHLDTLEKKFRTKVDRVAHEALDNIEETVIELNDKEACLQTEKIAIKNIQAHASDIQKYFYARKVQEKVAVAGKEITDILDKKLEIINLNYSLSKDVHDMMFKITELGSIKLKREQSKISLSLRENKQAQFNMPRQHKEIKSLKLKRIGEFDSHQKNGSVRGCCIVGNEDVIFTDHEFSHLIHFVHGSKTIIPIDKGAFDVTKIDEKRVAVSSGGGFFKTKHGITVFDFCTKTEECFISLPFYTYGVSFSNNYIYCSVENRGIYRVNVQDWTVSCHVSLRMGNYSYVHADRDRLYFTDRNSEVLYCYNITGTKTWEFRNPDLLRGYNIGVTADKNGTVFVSSDHYNNVLVISTDGRHCKVILTKSDGVKSPTGLHYNQSNDQIVVACCEDKAKYFKMVP